MDKIRWTTKKNWAKWTRAGLSSVAAAVALSLGAVVHTVQSASAAVGDFPLTISANGRFLKTAAGKPFMIHGDTAWSLVTQLSQADAGLYLEDRRAKGFNTVQVMIINHHFADNAPNNFYGHPPFTIPGDFSTPNGAYWANVDWVLNKAAEKGLLVIAAPAWVGTNNTHGWGAEIVNNGATKSRNYGKFLGNRYKNFKNIAWLNWGDRAPAPGTALEKNSLEILRGIEDNAPTQLQTAHINRKTTSREVAAFKPKMDLDATYSSMLPYVGTLRRYAVTDPRPIFLTEAYYEGGGTALPAATPRMVRRQAYWNMTSGATGHIYGNRAVQTFGWNGFPNPDYRGEAWKKHLDDPGTLDMAHLKKLLSGRAWYDLKPDSGATVVTGGRGTKSTTDTSSTDGTGSNYVTAARTADGHLVMAYIPPTGSTARTITVNMTKLSGPAAAKWFNPNTGVYTTIAGSPFPNTGSKNFTSPGANGDWNDWVLVLEAV